MSKMGDFIIWSEENGHCEWCDWREEYIWKDTNQAYSAYLTEREQRKQSDE